MTTPAIATKKQSIVEQVTTVLNEMRSTNVGYHAVDCRFVNWWKGATPDERKAPVTTYELNMWKRRVPECSCSHDRLVRLLGHIQVIGRSVEWCVKQQTKDEAIWFEAETMPEAYLQEEIRKLHVAVEVLLHTRAGGVR